MRLDKRNVGIGQFPPLQLEKHREGRLSFTSLFFFGGGGNLTQIKLKLLDKIILSHMNTYVFYTSSFSYGSYLRNWDYT